MCEEFSAIGLIGLIIDCLPDKNSAVFIARIESDFECDYIFRQKLSKNKIRRGNSNFRLQKKEMEEEGEEEMKARFELTDTTGQKRYSICGSIY